MAPVVTSRRQLLKSSVLTTTALSAAGPALGALGANERIRVGIIGSGGRGQTHIRRFRPQPFLKEPHQDAEVVAVCDPDDNQTQRAAQLLTGNTSVKRTRHFREVLDMKDVDAVFVASTCHWHAIPAIEAMQAGKDVYVEKPIGHTIHEGRVIVDTATRTKRIVQVGQQQRSHPHWQHAVERIRNGELGQITTVNVWNVWTTQEMGGGLGNPPDSDPPPGVDYDLWLGPAPARRFNPARFHFGFYFFFEYSSGMVCAWGVHLFDIVQWALGHNLRSASASGGIYVLKDARNTPDTVSAVFDYGDFVMSYQLRHTNGWQPFGHLQYGDMDHGIEFVGTKGLMHINRGGFYLYDAADRAGRKPYYSEKAAGDDTFLHHRDFFDCIRSRKQPRVPAEVGQQAAIPGYLANISYLLGRSVRWDADKQTILGDPEAAKLLTKEYREPWRLQSRA